MRSPMIGRALAIAALAWCALPLSAAAQSSYPNRPIRLIVPFAPGGTTEVLARIIAQKMAENLGQQLVVDNRPGAAGSLGTTLAVKSAADGYTLLLTSLSPIVINVNMYAGKPPYDSEKDLTPISSIIKVPSVLAVHPSIPLRTLKDVIAFAKANPGKLSYGSSGAGGVNHLITELFRVAAGIELLHVPYKGAGPAVIALLAKEVDTVVSSPVAIMPQVRSGQIRPIAVSSAKRSPAMADVPTISEAGVPGFEATAWYGLLGPGAMPQAIVERVRGALVKAMSTPVVSERLLSEGAAPESSTPEEFAKMIRTDIKLWGRAVEVSGAKLN
ncbi:MAG: tripartite tricarboxylate transporter substrate binding protein [Burkholderiales bacterium]|nr:tripartite tricarboxylate transporter substrate binding protein [Burkholderiales bacterium]